MEGQLSWRQWRWTGEISETWRRITLAATLKMRLPSLHALLLKMGSRWWLILPLQRWSRLIQIVKFQFEVVH